MTDIIAGRSLPRSKRSVAPNAVGGLNGSGRALMKTSKNQVRQKKSWIDSARAVFQVSDRARVGTRRIFHGDFGLRHDFGKVPRIAITSGIRPFLHA
jgi:hypothetical protein